MQSNAKIQQKILTHLEGTALTTRDISSYFESKESVAAKTIVRNLYKLKEDGKVVYSDNAKQWKILDRFDALEEIVLQTFTKLADRVNTLQLQTELAITMVQRLSSEQSKLAAEIAQLRREQQANRERPAIADCASPQSSCRPARTPTDFAIASQASHPIAGDPSLMHVDEQPKLAAESAQIGREQPPDIKRPFAPQDSPPLTSGPAHMRDGRSIPLSKLLSQPSQVRSQPSQVRAVAHDAPVAVPPFTFAAIGIACVMNTELKSSAATRLHTLLRDEARLSEAELEKLYSYRGEECRIVYKQQEIARSSEYPKRKQNLEAASKLALDALAQKEPHLFAIKIPNANVGNPVVSLNNFLRAHSSFRVHPVYSLTPQSPTDITRCSVELGNVVLGEAEDATQQGARYKAARCALRNLSLALAFHLSRCRSQPHNIGN